MEPIRIFLVSIGIVGTIILITTICNELNDARLHKDFQIEVYKQEIEKLQKKLYECQTHKQAKGEMNNE